MTKEGQPAGPNTPDDYEATVLDFLNKEMATIQHAHKQSKQSEEVDALVTDLLKQVITEADRTQSADKPPFDEDELFAGLPSESQRPPNPLKNSSSYPVISKKVSKKARRAVASLQEAAATPAPSATASRRLPVKALTAFACLAVVIGAAAYYFLGHSGKAPQSQLAADQVAESEIPAAAALPQLSNEPAVRPENSAAAGKDTVVPATKPVPAAQVRTKVQPVQQQQSTRPAPANTKPEPTPPKVNAEEKPSATQTAPANTKPEPAPPKAETEEKPPVIRPAPVAPLLAPIGTVVEKPPAQTVAEIVAPAIPERKPAPTPQVTSLVSEPPPPAPAPANTKPEPAPPPPVVSSNLIPAVPISQASPIYPDLALRTHSSGKVVLELQINDQGKVVKAIPVSGPTIFHSAAVNAAMKWRYKPASISGVNVSSRSKVTMSFNLKY